MQIYEMSLKSENFSDLSIPVSALRLLAQPSTPVEVREEVIERAAAGEPIKVNDVKEAVEQAKVDLPAPITASRKSHADRNFEKLVEKWLTGAQLALINLQCLQEFQTELSALTLSGEPAKIAKVIGRLDIRACIKIAEAAEKQGLKLRGILKAVTS
jgi:hypothetical protein